MICRTYCGKLAGTGVTASICMTVVYVILDLAGGNIFRFHEMFRLGGAAVVYISGIVLLAAITLLLELKPVFTKAYPAYTA